MYLAFYVSAVKIDTYGSTIKINADGYRASQAQYNFGYHVNMQLIKIPTTSYVNTTLKEMGA